MLLGKKILTSSQIREIDQYTIKHEPIASIDLMERASKTMAKWICEKFNITTSFKIFAGPGNNGGDALAVARLVKEKKFITKVYILRIKPKLSKDAEINHKRLIQETNISIKIIKDPSDFPSITSTDIVIDGLFGSGLVRPLNGVAAQLVQHINRYNTRVIAIDMPSGLFDTDNTANNYDNIIQADYTLSLQFPKHAFFFSENEKQIGEWKVLPIGLHPKAIEETKTPYFYVTKNRIGSYLKKRKKFAHKGNFGHALLVSGAYGKMGAAILGAKACLRSGVGLLTSHIPHCGYEIMQARVVEAMTLADKDKKLLTSLPDIAPYNAIGIGPGIGQHQKTVTLVEQYLRDTKTPMVLDADALNIIGKHPELKKLIPKNTIITPHPKEFERLYGEQVNTSLKRLIQQQAFSKKYGCIIVLKGAYTSITLPNGRCYFNTTGNTGMATAGSGDVLTGIILGLLAQSYKPEIAAILGVFVHGLAGDIAAKKLGQQGLIASDIIRFLPKAWKKLK